MPRLVLNATTPPFAVRLLPLTSLSCTVTSEVETPSAVMDTNDAVTVEVETEAAAGLKSTLAVSAIELPSSVPLIVAVPTVVTLVSVAV